MTHIQSSTIIVNLDGSSGGVVDTDKADTSTVNSVDEKDIFHGKVSESPSKCEES